MKYLIIIAVLVAYKLTSAPQRVQVVTEHAQQPAAPAERFAVALAQRLGNPNPSAATLHFIESWMRAEGTTAQFNPLATSQDMPGATVFNSHGVKNYATAQDGLDATVITLGYDYNGYSDICEGIRTNDPQRALAGLAASPWGTNAANVLAIYNEGLNAAQPVAYAPATAADEPTGNPLNDPRAVVTQGYGVGSHAPAATWGALDLALDTPLTTLGAPVYATISGVAHVSESWPCGTGVEVTNDRYRVLYCHLSGVAIADGQPVTRATQIGAVGSTGDSSGPHLHYEIWQDGSNVNPIQYVTR